MRKQTRKGRYGKGVLLLVISVFIVGLVAFTVVRSNGRRVADSGPAPENAAVGQSGSSAIVKDPSVVSPPAYRIVHQACNYPTPFVVGVGASDEEVRSLLWEIRGEIRSHAYYDLGLHQCDYDKAGMIEVFRGPKCASETYGEKNLPCGDGDHEAGSYQWGTGKDNTEDEGYIYSQDRTASLVFDAKSGDTIPGNIRSLINQRAQARKLDQQLQIKTLNDASQNTSPEVHFFPGTADNSLWVRSDLFSEESNRTAFISVAVRKLKPSLCRAGFASILLMSNSLIPSQDAYSLNC